MSDIEIGSTWHHIGQNMDIVVSGVTGSLVFFNFNHADGESDDGWHTLTGFKTHHEFVRAADEEMRLIGIAGQARSGKDTLASHLLANLDDWSRASFADPLKSMLTAIGVDCSDDAKAAIDDCFGVTPRHMMQTLGTEWGRHLIDNDIWVKAFARLNAGKCVIVPDVRFENEANLVREHGILIHLVGRGGIGGAHVSENPIDFKEGDIVIDNSLDLDWLQAQVDGNSVLSGFIDGVDE